MKNTCENVAKRRSLLAAQIRGICTVAFIVTIGLVILPMTGCGGKPAAANPTKVATPTANPGAGTYTSAQSVTLDTTTADATIYYTLDGTTPTEASTEYTAAISISTTTTLKAFAVKDDMDDSDVLTAVYTIDIPTVLTLGVFSEGNIPTTNGVQWFKFTTEAAQTTVYIHLLRGAMSSGKVTLYAEDRTTAVGAVDTTLGSTANMSRTVTASTVYFIKVTPYTGSGKYRIGVVNSTSATPVPSITIPTANATELFDGMWEDGNITYDGEEKWYKLTSATANQYIFADLLTIFNLNAQLYGADGMPVGSNQLFGRGTFISKNVTVTNDTEYYIRVFNTNNGTGTYKIAPKGGMNSYTDPKAPAVTMPTESFIPLSIDNWGDGNITTAGGEQWFSFNSGAATEIYIHLNLGAGTLNDIVFQLYDDDGLTAGSGSGSNLSSSFFSLKRTGLSPATYYYIRIKGYTLATGTFKLGVNETSETPIVETVPTSPAPINIPTVNSYVNGNMPSSGVQWFKFTSSIATDSVLKTQYIYFQPGTTLDNIYALVYTHDGRRAGGSQMSYSFYNYGSVSDLDNSTVYYIKVTPYTAGKIGTYKLAYGQTSTVPAAP